MSILLALLFPLAIQYERGGWWKLLLVIGIPCYLVDLVAARTDFALLMWRWPRPEERTVSQALRTIVKDPGWRGVFARGIARYVNLFDRGHV